MFIIPATRPCALLEQKVSKRLRAVLLVGLVLWLPMLVPCSARGAESAPAQTQLAIVPATDAPNFSQGQWVLVTAPALRSALTPLVEQRKAEGFKVEVLETTNVLTGEQIRQGESGPLRARLRQLFQGGTTPKCLLLAGAAQASDPALAEATVVPGCVGKVGRMKGQLSDFAFGLPDSNGVPAVAVGRFPAHSATEARDMAQKTLALERDCRPAPWRNRITLLQGKPGDGPFEPMAEALVQQATLSRLKGLHPAWEVHSVSHCEPSPYFLTASRLPEAVRDALQEGQFLSLYLGHSDASGLWFGNGYFMKREVWTQLKAEHAGVFFTCGCFACQVGGSKGDGYGLTAMRNPAGPVAVMGALGESYSALGLLAVDGLLRCCAQAPFPKRLATYWLAVQAGLAKGELDEGTFALYDQFDGSGGTIPLAVQRQEHLEMWLLLGDPALQSPVVPVDIPLEVAGPVVAGGTNTITGVLPERLAGAPVHLTLERLVASTPSGLEQLPKYSPENRQARERVSGANARRANDVVLAAAEAQVNGCKFVSQLVMPATLAWSNVVVRASARNQTESALGVTLQPVSRN
jgi:hypothetical protein